jgi:hypothetical protein
MKRIAFLAFCLLLILVCTPVPTQIAIVALETNSTGYLFEILSNRRVNYYYASGIYVGWRGYAFGETPTVENYFLDELPKTEKLELSEADYVTLEQYIETLGQYEPKTIMAEDAQLIQVAIGNTLYADIYSDFLDPRSLEPPQTRRLMELGYFFVDRFPKKFDGLDDYWGFDTPQTLFEKGLIDGNGYWIFGDSFGDSVEEFYLELGALLAPIYSDPTTTPVDCNMAVRHLLDYDLSEGIRTLERLYEKAIQSDKDDEDQEQRSKEARAHDIAWMKETVASIKSVEKIVNHKSSNEENYTEEERQTLNDFLRLWDWFR